MLLIKSTFLIALLLILLSCGKKEGSSSATLEISRGFAITNPYFAGGLIITGKSDSGQEFSMSLTTGTSLNLVLTKATWVIKAVGWDGGTAPEKLFAGLPHCGVIAKPLVMDNEVIDLVVTKEKCADPIFTSGNAAFVDHSTTPSTLKHLGYINTCNSFLLPTSPVIGPTTKLSDVLIKDGSLNTACDDARVPLDLRSQVRAIKIRTMEKKPFEPEMNPGLNSGCIAATGETSAINLQGPSSSYFGYNVRLPFSGIPLMIETFTDIGCTKFVADYRFKRGLADNYPLHFDHMLFPGTVATGAKLWLPGNDGRRAKSPFLAVMPFFKRPDSSGPVRFTTAPVTNTRIFHGVIGTGNKAIVNVPDCPAAGGVGLPVTGGVSAAVCKDLGDRVEVTFTGGVKGNGTFNLGGLGYNVYISDEDLDRYLSQNILIDLLGNTNTSMASTFYKARPTPFRGVDPSYGALAIARHFLGPKGAGVFGLNDQDIISNPDKTFSDVCQGIVGKQEKTVYNPKTMTLEKWAYVVSDNGLAGPSSFTCNDSSLSDADCAGNSYGKRMKVFNYAYSLAAPVAVLEFNCNGYIGRAEINAPFEELGIRTQIREIVQWNTWWGASGDGLQRFERLVWDTVEEFSTDKWVVKEVRRSMARMQKIDADDWNARVFNFNARLTGGAWVQKLDAWGMISSSASSWLNFGHNSALASSVTDRFLVLSDPLGYSPPATDAGYKYAPAAEWPMSITTLGTPVALISPVVVDVNGAPDGMDDNGADFIDGNLPMQGDSMVGEFENKFAGPFLHNP